MVLTTARSTAGGIASHLLRDLRARDDDTNVISALVHGNNRAFREFTDHEFGGGFLVGTKGLWQGVDVSDEQRLRLVWIKSCRSPRLRPRSSKRAAPSSLPEPATLVPKTPTRSRPNVLPPARRPSAPAGRRAAHPLRTSPRRHHHQRSRTAGQTSLRRSYRRTFLGSLDQDLLRDDPDTGEVAGGNVVPMAEGWARIWQFFARHGLLDQVRADELCTPDALDEHTLLRQTRRICQLALTPADVAKHTAAGTLKSEVIERAAEIGGLLRLSDSPVTLKESQKRVIRAVASGQDVLGLLPTGFGKSFCSSCPLWYCPASPSSSARLWRS